MDTLVASAPTWVTLLIGTALKSAIVLGCAGLLAAAMHRAPAAVRHWVWTAGILGALALPIVSRAVPAVPVPAPSALAHLFAPEVGLPGPSTVEPTQTRRAPARLGRGVGESGEATTADTSGDDEVAESAPARGMPDTRDVSGQAATLGAGRAADPSFDWQTILLLVWAVGATLALLRLASGLAVARWVGARAMVVTEPA